MQNINFVKGNVFWANYYLVGGFNPFEKHISQIGSFPQLGVNMKNIWNHYLALIPKPELRAFGGISWPQTTIWGDLIWHRYNFTRFIVASKLTWRKLCLLRSGHRPIFGRKKKHHGWGRWVRQSFRRNPFFDTTTIFMHRFIRWFASGLYTHIHRDAGYTS